MAKTQFVDGSFLTPTFLLALNGANASTGYTHDGLDMDGHGPKIDLANHTTGLLPLANVAFYTDWTDITAQVTTVPNAGSLHSTKYNVMKVGNTIFMEGSIYVNVAGASVFVITIPAGYATHARYNVAPYLFLPVVVYPSAKRFVLSVRDISNVTMEIVSNADTVLANDVVGFSICYQAA
jgi:hypothetical protein